MKDTNHWAIKSDDLVVSVRHQRRLFRRTGNKDGQIYSQTILYDTQNVKVFHQMTFELVIYQ